MAKITLSPLVTDIRNKIGDTVYSKWRGINYARSRVKPANPRTSSQQLVRYSLARMVDFFQHLHFTVKNAWNLLAKGKEYSGYNLFVGHNRVKEQNLQTIDLSLDTKLSQNLTGLDATSPTRGTIQVAFSPSPVPSGFTLILHFRKKPASTDKKTVHIVKTYSAGTTSPITETGFNTGETWQVYGTLSDNSQLRTGLALADEVTVS
jgi:hypothetical protein